MKKRLFALVLTLLTVAALLCGCGASNGSASYDYAPKEEMGAEAESPAAGNMMMSGAVTDTTSTASATQKLIKRVNITAETENLEALLPQLAAQIQALGGYVESQELYNGSTQSSYRYRSVSMTVRIPADRLAEFTGQVEGLSNVVNYSESTDDVTLQYVDTESRIKALELEQERLMELMAQAETMADLLEIQSRLTDVQYELESYASQLRTLQNKVSYATVRLNIEQVRVYTEVEPQTVWQRISGGFSQNLRDLGEDLTDFFVWAVTYSPQLLLWGIVIFLVVTVSRRRAAKKRAKKAAAQIPPESNSH